MALEKSKRRDFLALVFISKSKAELNCGIYKSV